MMDAGKLDKLVSLASPVAQRSPAGEELATGWKVYARPWANIKPVSATERIRNTNVAEEQTTHIITLHYTASLKPDHRVVYQGRVFEITSAIDVDEQHVEWRLICQETT